jgi:hypothetical protein
VGLAALAGTIAFMTSASGETNGEAAPIYGVKLPAGYRDWTLISVATVGAPVNDPCAKLGNDVAIKAYSAGTLPFPDGTIVTRLPRIRPRRRSTTAPSPRWRKSNWAQRRLKSYCRKPPTGSFYTTASGNRTLAVQEMNVSGRLAQEVICWDADA